MIKRISFIATIVIVGLIIYNLLSQILEALKSGDRLSSEAETLYQLEAKNRQLKKKLEEIKSPDFVEQQARNKLGLGKPGETVIIIPQEAIEEVLATSSAQEENRLPNPLGWWRVFFK